MHDKNSDSFAAHFAKHFIQKPSPQKCCDIMYFKILSTLYPIDLMKTWGGSSCTLCMKDKIEIVENSRIRFSGLINACSEVYGSYCNITILYRFTQH